MARLSRCSPQSSRGRPMTGGRTRNRERRRIRLRRKLQDSRAPAKESRGLSAALKHVPRLFPYLRPYQNLMALAVVLMVLLAALSLAAPWPLAFLVDSVLGNRRPPEIVPTLAGTSTWSMIVFAVLLGLFLTFVSNAVSILSSYVQTRLEQRM